MEPLATTAQFTSIRVVCNNTLAVALNGQGQAVKVPTIPPLMRKPLRNNSVFLSRLGMILCIA